MEHVQSIMKHVIHVGKLLIYFSFRPLEFPQEAGKLAGDGNFELKGYSFTAKKEELHSPRIVKFAVVQNEIVKPTTDPIAEQVIIETIFISCQHILALFYHRKQTTIIVYCRTVVIICM